MSLSQMKEKMRNLRHQYQTLAQTGVALADRPEATMVELNAHREQMNDVQARIDVLQASISHEEGTQAAAQSAVAPAVPADQTRLQSMINSREYRAALNKALRNRVNPGLPCTDSSLTVLYDAMTIAGGDPAGVDGGFLVPDDVQHTIHEQMRDLQALRSIVNVETVSTLKGSRVVDNAPTKGLTKVDGELSTIPQDDQPVFGQVPYSIDTYGLLLTLSRELVMNEAGDLLAYIGRWMAKKQVITENQLIFSIINTLTSQTIQPEDPDNAVIQLRRILNKELDPAISMGATILTNQSGYDYLDNLVDGLGRPLISPNPADNSPMIFKTRPIMVLSDAQMPNRAAGGGSYFPLDVGDFRQFITLFERVPLEVASSDVAGDSFDRNGVRIRGLTGLGVSKFDAAAVVRREIFVEEE